VRIGPGETQTVTVTIAPTLSEGIASGILNLSRLANLPQERRTAVHQHR